MAAMGLAGAVSVLVELALAEVVCARAGSAPKDSQIAPHNKTNTKARRREQCKHGFISFNLPRRYSGGCRRFALDAYPIRKVGRRRNGMTVDLIDQTGDPVLVR